jgi:hypothetical protein
LAKRQNVVARKIVDAFHSNLPLQKELNKIADYHNIRLRKYIWIFSSVNGQSFLK